MKTINGSILKKALLNGANNLSNHKEYVNTLNVFPVPDGDTGTNMYLTFNGGITNIKDNDADKIGDISSSFSKGLLMGARGNSGVITSQIFRGIAKYSKGKDELTTKELAEAFVKGSQTAYKAIMKAVEGTILTVIRESSEQALEDVNDDTTIEEYFDNLLAKAKVSLDNTPNLLPTLKEAGVVDSGGMGLVKILEGICKYFKGETVELKTEKNENKAEDPKSYGYCFEGILNLSDEYKKKFDMNILRDKLQKDGDLKLFRREEDSISIHVHSYQIGQAIDQCLRYGSFFKMKLENISVSHTTMFKKKDPKKYGIIAVSSGLGIDNVLRDCGVDTIISGGQTMNPSTEDFVSNIKELDNCKHIIVFPNNSNIIMAAKQAKDVLKDVDITVMETKSVQACLSAISMFDFQGELQDNIDVMNDIISTINTASITYAVKDTNFSGIEVKEGDFIAMKDKEILVANKSRIETAKKLIDELNKLDGCLITVIYGEDVKEDEVKELTNYISEITSLEINLIEGNQPVYSYLFGVE